MPPRPASQSGRYLVEVTAGQKPEPSAADEIPPQAGDVLLAVALGTIAVSLQYVAGSTTRTALGVVAGICGAVPVLFRRSHPSAAFCASAAAVLVVNVLAPIDVAVTEFVVFYCFYTVMVRGGRRMRLWAPVVSLVVLASAPLSALARSAPLTLPLINLLIGVTLWLTAWVLATLRRRRLRYIHELEDRTEVLEDELAEAGRVERQRIARELHDVVAHSLGVIAVQAGTGRRLAATQPQQAEAALATIERVSRESMVEMRRIVGMVREPEGSEPASPHAPAPPQPGLGRLDDLVAEVGAAGLDVEVSVVGEPVDVAAGIDLAAYRIVQESLTNARRHSGETAAHVTLAYRNEGLDVEVLDAGDGGAVASAGRGLGLVGMRERALVYGGSFEAGPASAGGFRVHAFLPFAQGSSGADE